MLCRMAIPDFRADGTLPPGEHVATWPEIVDRDDMPKGIVFIDLTEVSL